MSELTEKQQQKIITLLKEEKKNALLAILDGIASFLDWLKENTKKIYKTISNWTREKIKNFLKSLIDKLL